jgi:hypothetical protein
MTAPSPELRTRVRSVLERAVASSSTPDEQAQAIGDVCMQLHDEMSTLVGSVGFRALAGRAAHLTKRDCTCIELVDNDSKALLSVTRLSAAAQQHGAEQMVSCASIFLTHVVSLFARFIGDDLTLLLLARIWPDAGDMDVSADGREARSHERK